MKINFIMNSISDAHAIKRVNDFRMANYEVKVFGFLREDESCTKTDATIIGTFSNALKYRQRISIYRNAIKKLFSEHPDNGELWFYLGLDVAMFAYFSDPKRKFIYEECDLVQTYVSNYILRNVLESIDKYIIKKSLLTIFTSEGFIKYHYKDKKTPSNYIIVANKLSSAITNIPTPEPKHTDSKHLRFAFVGGIRYYSILSLAGIIGKEFPQHEFHFYGYVSPTIKASELPKNPNIHYHGSFKSPDDLPRIYSNIDALICTYDTEEINVRYAEPNKLYEAIYFKCPIIVSKNTLLEDKVKRLGIGLSVFPFDKTDVCEAVKKIESHYAAQHIFNMDINREEALDSIIYIDTITNITNNKL